MTTTNETLETPLEVLIDSTNPIVNDTPTIVEVIPEVPELPELQHTYQPTDEQGRPIGGKQVIKYRTTEELVGKMEKNTVHLLRKLREETRKNRLGIQDETPQEGTPYAEPIEFKSQQLTPEEALALSRDLLDPTRQAEAKATLWKSVTGVDPETFNNTMSKLQTDSLKLQAKIEADAFVAKNKDYVVCDENFQAITNWMIRYKLAPVRDNFQKAFNALKEDNILILNQPNDPAPIHVEPVVVPFVPELVVVKPVEYAPARIATGLTRESSGGDGVPPASVVGDDVTFTVLRNGAPVVLVGKAAIDAMPADEFRKRVKSDPLFNQKVELIEADFEKRRKRG